MISAKMTMRAARQTRHQLAPAAAINCVMRLVACSLCISGVRLCRQSIHMGGNDKAMHLKGHGMESNRNALVDRTSPSTPEV